MRKWLIRIVAVAVIASLTGTAVYVTRHYAPDLPVEVLAERWAPPPSQFIDVLGMQVHLRDEGPDGVGDRTLVLLHGTGASLHTWDGWVEALTDQYRVIRFDLPGFGLTGPDPQANYTIEHYAAVVVAVLDALGVQRAVLAGNSLGGHVAWATAVLHPERVTHLVLVDATGYPFEPDSIPLGFRIARTPVLNRLMEQVMPRPIVRGSVENVYGDPSLVTEELVDRYFDLTAREGNRRALADRLRQIKPGPLSDRIPEIAVPTLILWGGQDRLVPPSLGDRFEDEIAGSRLVRFPALGHVPHEEDPAATVAVVREFLAESDPIMGAATSSGLARDNRSPTASPDR